MTLAAQFAEWVSVSAMGVASRRSTSFRSGNCNPKPVSLELGKVTLLY